MDPDAGPGGEEAGAPAPVDPTDDPQVTALRALERASLSPVSVTFRNGFPTAIVGEVPVSGPDSVSKARSFLATYRDLFRQDPAESSLRVVRVEGSGDSDVVFEQTYEGLPVFGGQLVVHVDGDVIRAVAGTLVTSDVALADRAPKITARDAEALARAAAAAAPGAQVLGETRLMLFDRSLLDLEPAREPHLAYRVTLLESQLLVDAQTGQVLATVPTSKDAFDLDQETSNGTQAADTHCYWTTTADDQVADEDGVYTDYLGDSRIAKVWAFTRVTYDFYFQAFGRRSYDGADAQLEVYNHVKSPAGGRATWVAGCDLIEVSDERVGRDVFAHEFTHAVIEYSSGLIYHRQTGALNESYADVMAELSIPNRDWLMGTDTAGGLVRSLADPTIYGQPDRFSQLVVRPDTKAGDHGGVHTNSGIPNKAAYLVVNGGTFNHLDVAGIGVTKARLLLYLTMLSLPSTADFAMNRAMMVAVASTKLPVVTLPFTAADVCSVRNAWAAVEVGNPDRDCDGREDPANADTDKDHVEDRKDNCPMVANPSQRDSDGDGVGDACDDDDDGDRVPDKKDNCPNAPNGDQKDVNHDGIGDVCQDLDGDGVLDPLDNCVADPNANQKDSDADGDGDVCDLDLDADGITGSSDNCPFTANADQKDTDGDGLGDACDPCPISADDVKAWTTGIPSLGIPPKPIVSGDADGDGVPDSCDAEPLGPGVSSSIDNDALVASFGKLRPDGASRTISVGGPASSSFQFPIRVCVGPCPEWFEQGKRITLAFSRLEPRVGLWVADETGLVVARVRQSSRSGNGVRTVSFVPRGGRSYHLVVQLAPDFAPAAAPTSAFQLTMTATTQQ